MTIKYLIQCAGYSAKNWMYNLFWFCISKWTPISDNLYYYYIIISAALTNYHKFSRLKQHKFIALTVV